MLYRVFKFYKMVEHTTINNYCTGKSGRNLFSQSEIRDDSPECKFGFLWITLTIMNNSELNNNVFTNNFCEVFDRFISIWENCNDITISDGSSHNPHPNNAELWVAYFGM